MPDGHVSLASHVSHKFRDAVLPTAAIQQAEKFIKDLERAQAQGTPPAAQDRRAAERTLRAIDDGIERAAFQAAMAAGAEPLDRIDSAIAQTAQGIEHAERASARLHHALKAI